VRFIVFCLLGIGALSSACELKVMSPEGALTEWVNRFDGLRAAYEIEVENGRSRRIWVVVPQARPSDSEAFRELRHKTRGYLGRYTGGVLRTAEIFERRNGDTEATSYFQRRLLDADANYRLEPPRPARNTWQPAPRPVFELLSSLEGPRLDTEPARLFDFLETAQPIAGIIAWGGEFLEAGPDGLLGMMEMFLPSKTQMRVIRKVDAPGMKNASIVRDGDNSGAVFRFRLSE
jgi:hypothetical protein